jgi:AcrR family transcriptional regulator
MCYRAFVPATSERHLRRDAQANRERLVAAARDAFAVGGVDVSMDEIARRAGVGVGTIYRNFPTKDDLLDAVLEDAIDRLVAILHEALALDDAWAGFRLYLEHALDLHARNRGLKQLFAARGTAHARRRMGPLAVQLISRAQQQGTLRADFKPEDLRLVFRSAGAVIEYDPGSRRRFVALLLDGLKASR